MKTMISKASLWSLISGSIVVLLLACFSLSAHALYCGDRLIQLGDSKLKVLHACGKPDLIDPVNASDFGHEVWSYNRGANRLITTLKFNQEEVVVIKQKDGYGY